MKKTLALVLALAMVFSTITVAFAEDTLGADAQICADLGMLKGETGTVDAAYVATAPTRLQAAVMFLRLKGLEAEALAFTGADNFADGNIAWAEGKNLLAYLKANPQLGWVGDGTNFNPSAPIAAKEYYKVLLETLGYKQTTAEVVGDFTWDNVIEFAATVGLSKVADVANYTVNDLAIATVEALKLNVKDTEKTLVATLVEAGKISETAAVAAGLMGAAPVANAVAIDDVMASGNAAVDVTFEDDVDPAAATDVANYSIEGVAINSAVVLGSDAVRLNTEAMTSGKVYTLKSGEQAIEFTGVAKVSGGPEIKEVVGEDVEEVVVTFTKHIDAVTGMDVANYSIAGVTIVSAEIDPDDADQVILTTDGLKNKTKYTIKVTNVKSVDGTTKKSDSETFTTKYDLTAPKIEAYSPTEDVNVQTNQRIVLKFSEKVDQASAEDLANYSIKVDETDGAALDIVSVTWDDDDEDNVEIVTEPMEKREDYVLSVVNVADQRKVPNVMTRKATADFKGVAEDETAPQWPTNGIRVLSPTTILVTFTDNGSKIDEESALDLNNYDLEDLDIESIKTIKNEWKVFKALLTVEEMETGKSYELTISDVLDEFGNAMKETSHNAKGIAESFAAVKVDSVVATDENTVVVSFSDEVDETTAEDISNYEIDNGIGAATDATLEDDNKTVTLKVNDLVNGFEHAYNWTSVNDDQWQYYELSINGVEDLAGNVLDYAEYVNTLTAFADRWDEDGPEIESADVLNAEVVALTFDEAVYYNPGAEVKLSFVSGGVTDYVYLDAKDYTDDFTTVEFSTGTALTNGVEYTVVDASGITDLIGNNMQSIPTDEYQFEGTDDTANGEVEVDSYEQVNGTDFEITFTRWVSLFDGDGAGADVAAIAGGKYTVLDNNDVAFTASVDEDVVTLHLNSGKLNEDNTYAFDLRNFVRDLHENVVENADETAVSEFDPDYTDEDKPYVEEVVATSRNTIKVVFSEDIVKIDPLDAAAIAALVNSLDFKNYDEDDDLALDTTYLGDNDGDNVLKFKTVKSMESRYEYELTIPANAVYDFAGYGLDDTDSYYFDGTNLQ